MVFLPYSVDVKGRMLPDNRVQIGTREQVSESAGRTEIKAVRSMEMRGIISTSSSDAISSSSGGVIEFLKETGSAMAS
jgi:predicted deacylase